jgi:hypothetical protein
MSLSKIKALAVVLTITAMASAQFNSFNNARTTALGGAPLSDISGVYNYPVLMMGYTNQAQVTWFGAGEGAGGTDFGSFIAIKSINDMIAVGAYYNSIGFLVDDDYGLPDHMNTPHILLGFDLGMIKLGVDIFVQLNSNTSSSEVSGNVTDIKRSYTNPGLRLSTEIDLGDLGILGKLGIGMPSYNHDVGINDQNYEISGAYIEVGAEASYPIFNIDLTVGGEFATVNQQQQGNDGNGIPYDDERAALIKFYLSGEVNIMETAAAVLAYEYNRITGTTIESDKNSSEVLYEMKSMEGRNIHAFYAGVENSWDDAWKFDNLQFRTGLRYEITDNITKTDNTLNSDYTKTKGYADRTLVKPIIGLGVSKGPLTLDMALSFGRMFDNTNDDNEVNAEYSHWRGLMAGPTMAAASLTVKF